MPRGKRIVIERNTTDPVVHRIKSVKPSEMRSKRNGREAELRENVGHIVRTASQLYEQDKLDKDKIRSLGLLTIDEAYDEVARAGIDISPRAFGGRIERRSIASHKIGKKRLVSKPTIHDWIGLHKEYYSVKEAFTVLAKHEDLNLRAFIGRVEKSSIPSIKIGTQRWVPKDVIESLTHVAKNYYDVSQAIGVLQNKGIKIRRNAFERRLDRNRIPHEKIGGRRLIARDVMDELVSKEIALSQRKNSL